MSSPKFLLTFFCAFLFLFCQAKKKKKKPIFYQKTESIKWITADEIYLASDSLEGRRMGTPGEKLAANYIQKRFEQLSIPSFENRYFHQFAVKEGNKIQPESYFLIENIECKVGKDIVPFVFGKKGNLGGYVLPNVNEKDNVWLVYLKELGKGLNNPHNDGLKKIYERAKLCQNKGANAVLFINNISEENDFAFIPTSEFDSLKIPIAIVNYDCYSKNIKPNLKKDWIEMKGEFIIENIERKGTNVVAFKNNNALHTVVIGAHYDHLGYGEDHNSMYTGSDKQIHNGADDNASGISTMLCIADLIQKENLIKDNYLFIAFSGEELGLYGSKKFVEQQPYLTQNINYMINLDMVGRLKDSTKALTIGGAGTSPEWIPYIQSTNTLFNVKFDSSGVGPSDHTSFYLKNIPVLFYFTGLHSDYHKPSDDIEKINIEGCYEIAQSIFTLVKDFDKKGRVKFSKTRDSQQDKVASFKVTLGIMPDYTYNEGNGIRVDGIIDGKIAKKYGVLAGDIVQKLGTHKVTDMMSYMEALSKFKKGEATKVEIKRGKELKSIAIKFE
jgi:hypothetical protein